MLLQVEKKISILVIIFSRLNVTENVFFTYLLFRSVVVLYFLFLLFFLVLFHDSIIALVVLTICWFFLFIHSFPNSVKEWMNPGVVSILIPLCAAISSADNTNHDPFRI